MRKIRGVLRYRQSTGLSLEAIARALNLSKGVVAKYLKLATAAGLAWPLPEELDDETLERRLYGQPAAKASAFVEPDQAAIHQELKRKGVTLTLLWEEYRQVAGDGAHQYTAFCTRYKARAGQLKRSMRQIHRAGEKLFADYAGPTVPVIDADTGEIRPASIFVAVLGASSYTFACATPGQTQADWLAGLERALLHAGGTPELLVSDNPKALVTLANPYEPDLTRAAAEFAKHYHEVILPARRRKPQDKAKVEAGVKVVERWILARLRHWQFFSVAEVDAAVAALLPDLNQRPFKKLPGCRQEALENRETRRTVSAPAAGDPLRARFLAPNPRQYRLPRRTRRPLLQRERATCLGRPEGGTAQHPERRRDSRARAPDCQPSAQFVQGRRFDRGRAYAGGASGACRMVARTADELGELGRPGDRRTGETPAHG